MYGDEVRTATRSGRCAGETKEPGKREGGKGEAEEIVGREREASNVTIAEGD